MLQMMADAIIETHLNEIKTAGFYSSILDETSDITRREQISFSIRVVKDDFTIREIFVGFYETKDTKSETLFKIVIDVLNRFGLQINKLRGQCFDGASNVSGGLTGLQARIGHEEPRALYVHCAAHRVNLAVQDAMEKVFCAKEFLGVLRELITFVKDSPKRLAVFKDLQSDNAPNLTSFCPNRYVNLFYKSINK